MECQVCRQTRLFLTNSDPTRSLASMSPNPSNSNEIIAGGNGLMLANMSTGQIVRRVSRVRKEASCD